MGKNNYSDNDKRILANNLNLYMKAEGVSKQRLSTEAKIPYTTLLDWLKGRNYPSTKYIEKLAKYFDISIADLQKNISVEEAKVIENKKWIAFIENVLKDTNYSFTDEQKKQMIDICRDVLKEDK